MQDLHARHMSQEDERLAKEATQRTESMALGVLQSFCATVIISDCHMTCMLLHKLQTTAIKQEVA